ncbi:uncharacterized protein LOC120703708 isoform X2 [Panicum virgatum]|nr:uncharacterized protein LOC120703708 isoform X2 [Panicum virgatum]
MRRYSKKKKNRCGHAALCSPAIPCAARARASRASCSASSPRPRDSLRLRRPCLPHQRHPRPCRPGDLCSASSPRPPRFPAPPASVLPRRAAKPAPAGDYLARDPSVVPPVAVDPPPTCLPISLFDAREVLHHHLSVLQKEGRQGKARKPLSGSEEELLRPQGARREKLDGLVHCCSYVAGVCFANTWSPRLRCWPHDFFASSALHLDLCSAASSFLYVIGCFPSQPTFQMLILQPGHLHER